MMITDDDGHWIDYEANRVRGTEPRTCEVGGRNFEQPARRFQDTMMLCCETERCKTAMHEARQAERFASKVFTPISCRFRERWGEAARAEMHRHAEGIEPRIGRTRHLYEENR